MTTPTRPAGPPVTEKPDLSEKGGRGSLDRRLFIQVTGLRGQADALLLGVALEKAGVKGALYADANDPQGWALACASEDPSFFTGKLRAVLNAKPFDALSVVPDYAMLGRTYSIGYEPNLEEWLIEKPQRTLTNPAWPWAVWYPLRRKGEFNQLPVDEQKQILKEHSVIGFAFGDADFAHDIRLACHGLDKNDNDFVIGLLGKELYPLSALVQTMRKTQQTSRWIQNMGPFFVGKAVWQSK